TPGPHGLVTRDRLRASDVTAALAAPHAHHLDLPAGIAARRLSWKQCFYWDGAGSAPLSFRGVGVPALLHHEAEACFAPSLIAALCGARVAAARLTSLGYELHDGLWWLRSDITHLGPPRLFLQPVSLESSDGGHTDLEYDRYALCLVASTDAVGNRT